MPENELPKPLQLDPWAASSLLQKAIRRGEVELARSAAHTLYRYRGPAIFRRLCTIAVEDIGIADISLLHEVARIGTDKALRSVLGSDAELIDDLCSRMAAASKDRSADYLICAATKLESAAAERTALKRLPADELMHLAADVQQPLTRRAVVTLLACTVDKTTEPVILPDRTEQLLDAFALKHLALHDAVLQLARNRANSFCLLLPLIWSRWSHEGAEFDVVQDELPRAEYLNGVPLYAFDFHTAAGKHAIARFVSENKELAGLLARWVPNDRRSETAAIACFYADAAPVSRRLQWSSGSLLSRMGFMADMIGAGCEFDGALQILDCVRNNLDDLNRLRREALAGRPRV